MTFPKTRLLFFPDASGGGGAPPADIGLGDGADTASRAGADAGGGGGDEEGADDFADLAGDERVQKYLASETSKRTAHIPKDLNSPEAVQKLLAAQREYEALKQDPQWQAFRAGAAGRQGGAQPPQEAPFHAAVLEAMEKVSEQPLSKPQRAILGAMIDNIASSLEARFLKTHIDPLKNYLVRQHFDREIAEARKLPDYAKHEPKVRELVERYGIPHAEAYKLAMYDELKNRPAGDSAPESGAEEPAKASARRSGEGDRPSGAGGAMTKMPKYKDAAAARNGAAAYLRSRGIKVE